MFFSCFSKIEFHFIVQNRNSPLEMKPFVFKGNFKINTSLPNRKFSLSNTQKTAFDIKINNEPISEFKEKEKTHFKKKNLKTKELKKHLVPFPNEKEIYKNKVFKTEQNDEDKSAMPQINKSNNNIRISKPKNVNRKIATSMSSRNNNKIKEKKNINNSKNGIIYIPYLNQNQYSALGIKGKDLIHWEMAANLNMNVFNTPGIYSSLPFLLENRENSGYMSRNLLVDSLK